MTATRTAARHARRAALAVGLAALLVVPSGGPASSENPLDVRVAPTAAGDTAVHDGQTVTVSGTAPAGPLASARLIAYGADGSVLGEQVVDRYVLNAADPGPGDPVRGGGGDFLRNDDGTLSGRLTLFCLFGDPALQSSCAERGGAAGDVRALRLDLAVGDLSAASAPLRVDYTRPLLQAAELLGTTSLLARFSEPVRKLTGTPDAPTDWVVTQSGRSIPVTAVAASRGDDCAYGPADDATAGPAGCGRTLSLAQPVDEDAADLTVRYVPDADYQIPVRSTYEDFASNRALTAGVSAVPVVDRIRPPRPTIDSVAGRPAAERVDGNDPTPAVVVSGVRAGHAGLARITSGGTTTETAPVASGGGTLTLQLPDLGADGDSRVEVVVVDPNGNRSTDGTATARPDGGPSVVTYRLDTVAPFLLGAATDPERRLTVTLSEPVAGSDDPARWTLASGRRITAVTGADDVRQLTVEGGATAGDLLTYTPAADPYADRAGNTVQRSTVPVSGVPAPVVLLPGGQVFTAVPTQDVGGSGRTGDAVSLFRDQDRNGVPDGAAVATTTVADGRWTTVAPLLRNTPNDLLAQASGSEGRSPFVLVPRVVHDDVVPSLAVDAPTAGAVLAGGKDTAVEWTTSDANHGPGAVVEVALAFDGSDFRPVASGPASSGGTAVRLPAVDAPQARVRLTTTDLAGNTATATSAPFAIDATTPLFVARTVAPREVEVLFSEPVSGPLGPDWQVAGAPATAVSADRQSGPRADRATVLVLRTTADFDPDSRPEVRYAPVASAVTGELQDDAGQPLPLEQRRATADDRIRPAVPAVETVAGRDASSGEVLAGEREPVVAVSGVRAGNRVLVERAAGGGAVVAGSPVVAEAATASVVAPRLPADGPHLLRAVAVDPSGNRSTDALRAPSADGEPGEVVYTLDSARPALLLAEPRDGGPVRVVLTEPVTGPNSAGDWSFTDSTGTAGTVTQVSGNGAERLVTISGPAAGGTLTYRPVGPRYVDAAGNEVLDASLLVGGVPAPVVLDPSTGLLTKDGTATVRGAGRPGDTVELLRGTTVVDTATVDRDGRWAVTAPLEPGENRFAVRAVRGDQASAAVEVPPVTRDATPPAVTLLAPVGGELFAGGDETEVRWTTSDTYADDDGVVVELFDGARWTVLDGAAGPGNGDGSTAFTVPAVNTTAAKVRVTATDLAGNSSARVSDVFTVDSLGPLFSASTVAVDTLVLRFTEPLFGRLAPSDFLVADGPAVVVAPTSPQLAGVSEVRLRTAVPFGPNDTPLVRYRPSPVSAATDEAGNPLANDVARAVDRIVPVAPTVTDPGGTVYEAGLQRAYSGSTESRTFVQLIDDGRPVSEQVGSSSDGAWRATGQLRRDTAVRLSAVAVDPAGNRSAATAAPVVVQDSQAPQVDVDGVERGRRYEPDTDVRIGWQATDVNLAPGSVVVDVTTDGGRTWQQLGRDLAATGSLTWRTPSEPTSAAAVRVRALDLADRTGAASEGFFGIGRAAATAAPPPSGPAQALPARAAAGGVDAELSVRERVAEALPRTGTDLLRVVLFALVTLLTGAGLLVAGRNQRRLSQQRRT